MQSDICHQYIKSSRNKASSLALMFSIKYFSYKHCCHHERKLLLIKISQNNQYLNVYILGVLGEHILFLVPLQTIWSSDASFIYFNSCLEWTYVSLFIMHIQELIHKNLDKSTLASAKSFGTHSNSLSTPKTKISLDLVSTKLKVTTQTSVSNFSIHLYLSNLTVFQDGNVC